MISGSIERFIFWSRWMLAPIYLGLIVGLGVLMYKFGVETWLLVAHATDSDVHQFVLDLLGLLDLLLLGNLILIVLFAGYENFVSKIEVAEDSVDRPYWMGTVDFSGLKIKLIGSLVAISVIELLKDFIMVSASGIKIPVEQLTWQVIIHLTFVISGVLFAVMDWISDNRVLKTLSLHSLGGKHHNNPEEVVQEIQEEMNKSRGRKMA
jgi:uncharacterized protein (TIGR00645 family)